MRELTAQVIENEPQLRAMLRLSPEERPPAPERVPLRRGRAIGWIEDALAPLRGRLPEGDMSRLVLAIRSAPASRRSCGSPT